MVSHVPPYMVWMCFGRKLYLFRRDEISYLKKDLYIQCNSIRFQLVLAGMYQKHHWVQSPIKPTCPPFNRIQSIQPLIIKPRSTHHDQTDYKSPLCPSNSLLSLQKPSTETFTRTQALAFKSTSQQPLTATSHLPQLESFLPPAFQNFSIHNHVKGRGARPRRGAQIQIRRRNPPSRRHGCFARGRKNGSHIRKRERAKLRL